MRPIWILAAFAGLLAGPASAQGLIAPSRQYSTYATPQREKLDKTYGLPAFATPGDVMPKQKATTTDPQDRPPTPFSGLSTFAQPDAQPSDTPDFFQKPSGLASSEAGVPNFFQDTTDTTRPKAGTKPDGETPMYTTGDGMETGDTSSGAAPKGDTSTD